jgi:hypothetical protein
MVTVTVTYTQAANWQLRNSGCALARTVRLGVHHDVYSDADDDLETPRLRRHQSVTVTITNRIIEFFMIRDESLSTSNCL